MLAIRITIQLDQRFSTAEEAVAHLKARWPAGCLLAKVVDEQEEAAVGDENPVAMLEPYQDAPGGIYVDWPLEDGSDEQPPGVNGRA